MTQADITQTAIMPTVVFIIVCFFNRAHLLKISGVLTLLINSIIEQMVWTVNFIYQNITKTDKNRKFLRNYKEEIKLIA